MLMRVSDERPGKSGAEVIGQPGFEPGLIAVVGGRSQGAVGHFHERGIGRWFSKTVLPGLLS